MIVSIHNGDWYYNLFYQLAVIVSFVIFMAIGIRRKYPLQEWLLFYISTLIFVAVGVRLCTFDLHDWTNLFRHAELPDYSGKTELGAIAGVLLGTFFARLALKRKYPALDVFGFLAPVTLFLQRIGCFLAGCCFGNPTGNICNVAYSHDYNIHTYHRHIGLIAPDASLSAAVHPVQLYLALSQVFVLLILLVAHRRLKSSGSTFLLAVATSMLFRFGIEFLRDPLTNHQLGFEVGGMKVIQWLLLGLVLVFTLSLLWNERRYTPRAVLSSSGRTLESIAFTLALVLVVLPFNGLLNRLELFNIGVQFILLFIIGFASILRFSVERRPALNYALLFLFAVLWMSQTQPERIEMDSTSIQKTEQGPNSSEEKPKRVTLYSEGQHTFSGAFGKLSGVYAEDFIATGPGGCGVPAEGYWEIAEYQSKYAVGYEYEHAKVKDNGKTAMFNIGLSYNRVFSQTYEDEISNLVERNLQAGFSVGMAFGADWKNFGYRLGAQAGRLYRYHSLGEKNFRIPELSGNAKKLTFIPTIRIRAGSYDKTFVEFGLADDFEYGMYRYTYRGLVGHNFSKHEDLNYRAEIGFTNRGQLILSSDISISKSIAIKPSVYLLHDPLYSVDLIVRPGIKKKKRINNH